MKEETQLTVGLMSIPLVRQAFSDPLVRVAYRAVDKNWMYEKLIPFSLGGFNPFTPAVYVAADSAMANWIRTGSNQDRQYNESDFLTTEVLFAVHDYLHVWARMVIQSEMPELEFGHGAITKDSVEQHVFCHILTEAVATVGLDYWYLSTIDLDAQCRIGTNMRNLTCDYRESDLAEYRQFDPDLTVQSPEFLTKLCEFYCTGEFDGFGTEDLRASAKLHAWLKHELTYGETQRSYIRVWLSYLSNGAVTFSSGDLTAPIVLGAAWQVALMQKLSDLLWRKVKKNEMLSPDPSRVPAASWAHSAPGVADFRFTNLNTMDNVEENVLTGSSSPERNFAHFSAQLVSSYKLESFPKEEWSILRHVLEKRDIKSLFHLLRKNNLVRVDKPLIAEPPDLFLLG